MCVCVEMWLVYLVLSSVYLMFPVLFVPVPLLCGLYFPSKVQLMMPYSGARLQPRSKAEARGSWTADHPELYDETLPQQTKGLGCSSAVQCLTCTKPWLLSLAHKRTDTCTHALTHTCTHGVDDYIWVCVYSWIFCVILLSTFCQYHDARSWSWINVSWHCPTMWCWLFWVFYFFLESVGKIHFW